jgi:hypothetical protein
MRWSPIKHTEGPLVATDPYFHWRLGAGATRCGANLVRPVVVYLQESHTAGDLKGWIRDVCLQTNADEPALRLPSFYTDGASKELEGARWCTGLAKPEFFKLLDEDKKVKEHISRVAVLSEIAPPDKYADQSTDEELGKDEQPAPWKEGSVVIGIIDFGFAFAHERFRRERTTRIEYLWVQDAPPTVSSAVPYGHEITAGTINRWLAERDGCTDEDVLYRRASSLLGRRWLRSVSRRMAHGTHVLDLASGYDLDESERMLQRPIVCVQLPEATVADTSGASLDSYVLDGIRYILKRADEIAEHAGLASLPVVINFSSGEVAGPHDGSSDLEQAIDELIKLRSKIAPLEVVIAAGNSQLGRLHAEVLLRPREPVDLHWRVLPDDSTPTFLEIWLPHRPPAAHPADGSRIKLKIRPPGEESEFSEWLDDSQAGAHLQYESGNGVLCEIGYHYVSDPTNRGMFLIAVQPTRRDETAPSGAATSAVAPSGTWTVTLANTGLNEAPAAAWIQWDDAPLGFPRRGRQSYFDEECYQRFFDVTSKDRVDRHRLVVQGREIEEDADQPSCRIRRAGSMNGIATGERTVVVGGYLGKERRLARYSAGGPNARGGSWKRDGPDAVAVSDDSVVHRGILAAGTRSGSVVAMDGTSVAAPQVTRLLAEKLAEEREQSGRQVARPTGREIVQELARQGQKRPAAVSVAPELSKERGGAGRIQRSRDDELKRSQGRRRH